jgi:hypothetical protein
VTLVTLPGPGHSFAAFPVHTYSFPETGAKFFCVLVAPPSPARRLNGPGKDTAQLELPTCYVESLGRQVGILACNSSESPVSTSQLRR